MSDLLEKVLYILGGTIVSFCARPDQQTLIKLYPYITQNNYSLKWNLFQSQPSLQHYIETTAIPTFRKIFKPSYNDTQFIDSVHKPVSFTTFNIKGIEAKDIEKIYNAMCDADSLTKKSYPFHSFKSFVIISLIEELYKMKFTHYKPEHNASFLKRDAVNSTINMEINRNELSERISEKYSDYDNFIDDLNILETKERGILLHILKNKDQRFDFELRVVKEINDKFDFEWFEKYLINIQNHVFADNDKYESFSCLLNDRLSGENVMELNDICQVFNNIFLSELNLFSDLIIIYGEEAFLSIKSDEALEDIFYEKCCLYSTMDILFFAITLSFDKVVLVQCLLEQRKLSLRSSDFYYYLL